MVIALERYRLGPGDLSNIPKQEISCQAATDHCVTQQQAPEPKTRVFDRKSSTKSTEKKEQEDGENGTERVMPPQTPRTAWSDEGEAGGEVLHSKSSVALSGAVSSGESTLYSGYGNWREGKTHSELLFEQGRLVYEKMKSSEVTMQNSHLHDSQRGRNCSTGSNSQLEGTEERHHINSQTSETTHSGITHQQKGERDCMQSSRKQQLFRERRLLRNSKHNRRKVKDFEEEHLEKDTQSPRPQQSFEGEHFRSENKIRKSKQKVSAKRNLDSQFVMPCGFQNQQFLESDTGYMETKSSEFLQKTTSEIEDSSGAYKSINSVGNTTDSESIVEVTDALYVRKEAVGNSSDAVTTTSETMTHSESRTETEEIYRSAVYGGRKLGWQKSTSKEMELTKMVQKRRYNHVRKLKGEIVKLERLERFLLEEGSGRSPRMSSSHRDPCETSLSHTSHRKGWHFQPKTPRNHLAVTGQKRLGTEGKSATESERTSDIQESGRMRRNRVGKSDVSTDPTSHSDHSESIQPKVETERNNRQSESDVNRDISLCSEDEALKFDSKKLEKDMVSMQLKSSVLDKVKALVSGESEESADHRHREGTRSIRIPKSSHKSKIGSFNEDFVGDTKKSLKQIAKTEMKDFTQNFPTPIVSEEEKGQDIASTVGIQTTPSLLYLPAVRPRRGSHQHLHTSDTSSPSKQRQKHKEIIGHSEGFKHKTHRKKKQQNKVSLQKPVAYYLPLETMHPQTVGKSTAKDHHEKRNIQKKRSRNHCGEVSQQEKEPATLTLQEALQIYRPDYIQHTKTRQSHLSQNTALREIRAQKKRQWALLLSSRPPGTKSRVELTSSNTAVQRIFSYAEMRQQTEKKYAQLPEVRLQVQDLKRKESYRTNRLMAEIFNKRLQENVLKGKVSLTHNDSLLMTH